VRLLEDVVKHRERVEALSEGRISPHVDIQYVYDYLFRNVRPLIVHEPYCVRNEFLSLTCTTRRMLDQARNIIDVLVGKPMKNVFVMPAYFGAGKSHFLAFLIHIMALYKEHHGSGSRVSEELRKFGIELSLPELESPPNIVLYHGENIRKDNPPWSDISTSLPRKEEIQIWVKAKKPLLIIFDETGMLDNILGRDFADYMQMLSEVVSEQGSGCALIVSYSYSSEAELQKSPSFDRLKRVPHQPVDLDIVDNIIDVYRRWAGISIAPGYDEVKSYLKGAFEETEIKEFYDELKKTYPFNPVTFRTLSLLAEESLARATKIQFTRGLLQHMMMATVNAIERMGALVIHADLPDPKDVIVPPKEHEKTWHSLEHLYSEDVDALNNVASRFEKIALRSMMKHVFFMSFIGRLLPRTGIYPDENRLVLGSFDSELDMLAIINAQRSVDEGRYRMRKTAIGYLYLPLTEDVYDVVKRVVDTVADDDGYKVVTHEVEQIIKNMPKFDHVVVVGWKDADEKLGNLISFADGRNAEKFVESQTDKSTLIVPLKNVAVKSRNNTAIIKPKNALLEENDAIRNFIRSRFKIDIDNLRDALAFLGRVKFAADEILRDIQRYFPDIAAMMEEWQRRVMEEATRAQLNSIKEGARSMIRYGVERWLHRYILGFKEYDGSYQDLRKNIVNTSDRSIVESILSGVSGFIRIGDLWSQWLNNNQALGYPINFSKFINEVLEICRETCDYVVREVNTYYWLSEDSKDRYPALSDPRNAEIAAAFDRNGNINEPIVEEYLKTLDRKGEKVFIEYTSLDGSEHRTPLDQFIASRNEWVYLRTARVVRETVARELSVTVNGREELIAILNPRNSIAIDVTAKEPLIKVLFEWQSNIIEGALSNDQRAANLQIIAPEAPGDYGLTVKAIFADGYEDERIITIRVRGRAKKPVRKKVIQEDAELTKMHILSVSDSDYVLQRFKTGALKRLLDRVHQFMVSSNVEDKHRRVSLNVNMVVGKDNLDNVQRMVKVLGHLTQRMELTVAFEEPVKVTRNVIDEIRQRNVEWEVLEEEEL